MFPIVVRRSPPTGHLLTSSLFDRRWRYQSRPFPNGSKTESVAVARRDSERDLIVANTGEHDRSGTGFRGARKKNYLRCKALRATFAINDA